ELTGRQHALVDHDLRREAAHVEVLPLREALVLAQTMARALADQVELALERIALEPVARGDEELLDVRLRGARRVAEVRAVRIDRHRTPADQPLAFLRADPRDRLLADRA